MTTRKKFCILTDVDGYDKKVYVGDVVGFKCDIEQTGEIADIRGTTLTLKNEWGFSGDYIGGMKVTEQDAGDCWAY